MDDQDMEYYLSAFSDLLRLTLPETLERLLGNDEILLESTEESSLLSVRLEPPMAKLASRIDPFEADLLSGPSGSLLE